MVEKIAVQSIGGIEGIYLPSQENSKDGTLLSDYGVFFSCRSISCYSNSITDEDQIFSIRVRA